MKREGDLLRRIFAFDYHDSFAIVSKVVAMGEDGNRNITYWSLSDILFVNESNISFIK